MDAALARRRNRSRPLIVLLALLSVTLVAIDQAGSSAPTHTIRSGIQDASHSVVNSVDRLWPFGDSDAVKKLKAQNANLTTQLAEAQGQLAEVSDAERQRDELTALNNLVTPDNLPKVIASITAIGASNFDNTIQLGKGSAQSIKVGMPVISDKGLIGRVVQVSSKTSTVLLIQDTTSNVGLRFPSGDIGVGVGDGTNSNLRVDLIDLNSQIKTGDVAVTSGEDHSIFPPGIPVGTVASVAAPAQSLREQVQLAPAVNVNKLSEVAVLQWTP